MGKVRRGGPNPSCRSPRARLELTSDESIRFVRVVSGAAAITQHHQLDRWLTGELQDFLPHDILIAAWGDFAQASVRVDVASRLSGARTAQSSCSTIQDLIYPLYERWVCADREPVMLNASELLTGSCGCSLHAALRAMRCGLAHGVHDKRAGYDSLYVALSSSGSMQHDRKLSCSMIDRLIAQVDVAFRRVPAFTAEAARDQRAAPAGSVHLSSREQQILDRLCRGDTNLRIAETLKISPFTVNNHVQSIFRKIGVHNRTQAAARYTELLRSSQI